MAAPKGNSVPFRQATVHAEFTLRRSIDTSDGGNEEGVGVRDGPSTSDSGGVVIGYGGLTKTGLPRLFRQSTAFDG